MDYVSSELIVLYWVVVCILLVWFGFVLYREW